MYTLLDHFRQLESFYRELQHDKGVGYNTATYYEGVSEGFTRAAGMLEATIEDMEYRARKESKTFMEVVDKEKTA